MNITLVVLCALVGLFHLGDVYSTQRAIRAGGFENNPFGILQRLQRVLPGRWTWLWMPKTVVMTLQWGALWWLWPNDWIIAVTGVSLVIHGWAIANNLDV